jgi:hypothetical protein
MYILYKVIELAWSIVEKNRECAINISTIDNKLTISILRGRRRETYCDADAKIVMMKMRQHVA